MGNRHKRKAMRAACFLRDEDVFAAARLGITTLVMYDEVVNARERFETTDLWGMIEISTNKYEFDIINFKTCAKVTLRSSIIEVLFDLYLTDIQTMEDDIYNAIVDALGKEKSNA